MSTSGSESQAATATPSQAVMFPRTNIPLPNKLELKGNLAENWKKFRQVWNNYEIAAHLRTQGNEVRTATLLTCIGNEALDVYNGLSFTNDTDKTDINVVIQKLEEFCIGKTNVIFERYKFNKREQQEGEMIESFVAGLRTLAKTCNFSTLEESLIRDRIVVGVRENQVRKRLLQESELSLQKCINICSSYECTAKQMKEMKPVEEVSGVAKRKPAKKNGARKNNMPTKKNDTETISCKFCGKDHQKKKELCPALGKTCKLCQKQNHFAVMCKSSKTKKTVQTVDSDSEDDYVLSVETRYPKRLFTTLELNQTRIKFQLDCGATVNVLPISIYKTVMKDPELLQVNKSQTTLLMYNKSQMRTVGKRLIDVKNPKNQEEYKLEFVILKEDCKPLLSARTIQMLNLMTVNTENILLLKHTEDTKHLIDKYADVFSGEGKLEEKLHLQLDETVAPVKMPVRNVPIAVKDKLKQELDRLESLGIIKPVEVPTEWISSMVVVMKPNGKIRLCIDPKPLNTALKRNHYPLPTIEDILPDLAGAKVFSVLDAKNGFWQVELEEESSLLTTFGTPWGKYRWTRMPFGISSAPEEFQRRLNNALGGVQAKPIADDILICGIGKTKEEAYADHDKKLEELLKKCREKGVKLNKEKMKLKLPEVQFMGHIISADGLKLDPSKVEAIKEMPQPKNRQDVRRLLGMVNYLQKFAPNLSEITQPLREMLKEENAFVWLETVHGKCFNEIKDSLSKAPVLKYFNPDEDIVLQCDASQSGLGASLMQSGQPVAYVSRSLTPTESSYAQIEKEMLSIVFAAEKFERYIYGRKTKVETDHKPLEIICKKSLLSAPKRLQRMMLKLQKFELEICYKKGVHMYLADTLSRAYLPYYAKKSEDCQENVMQIEDNRGVTEIETESIQMTQYLAVSETTLEKIRVTTLNDPTMDKLKLIIRQGWPEEKENIPNEIRDYFAFRDELSVQNGLIFKGERLVIPVDLREYMIERLHESHIGVQGTLRRAREAIYWPRMHQQIQECISKCSVCKNHPAAQQKEPHISHKIPSRPWEFIASDLFEFNKKDYLITVDFYSNFVEIDSLEDKTGTSVIKALKQHLARHGIPDEMYTDNGPPYNSEKFKQFADKFGFTHVTSSPAYPQSNGKVENAVKTVKALLQKAFDAREDPYLSLLAWRNTPSENLRSSPAQRLFGRRTKTPLPMSRKLLEPKLPEDVKSKLKEVRSKQAWYYNRNAKELTDLKRDDVVRIQPTDTLKKSKWLKAKVDQQVDIRSYRVRTEDGRVFRRNRRHLKKTDEMIQEGKPDQDSELVPVTTRSAALQPAPDPVVTESAKKPSNQPGQNKPEAQSLKPSECEIRTRSGRLVKKPVAWKDFAT